MFEFEVHGRSPNRFKNWVQNLSASVESANYYKKTVLSAGICK